MSDIKKLQEDKRSMEKQIAEVLSAFLLKHGTICDIDPVITAEVYTHLSNGVRTHSVITNVKVKVNL